MNKTAIATLIPIVAMVVVLNGCLTTTPAAVTPTSKAPELQPGVFEFEVGNSLYPKSRGASIGFQRYLSSGEEVTGSLEWRENYAVRYKWSLYSYAPDGSIALDGVGQI